MFCSYDAASISIPQLIYESFFHMISRIITNLAIYSWYDSYRTKDRCSDTSSNHLHLLYKLTERRSMFFTTDLFPTGVMYYMVT